MHVCFGCVYCLFDLCDDRIIFLPKWFCFFFFFFCVILLNQYLPFRQLVIQYVRHRVVRGAKYHRTDWSSLPDLPAPPVTCKRRMALLNRNRIFRKAVMRLCNVLGARYAKHLEKTQNRSPKKGACGMLVQSLSVEGLERNFSNVDEHTQETGLEEKPWYDFDDESLKADLDEVMWYKRMGKLEASRRVESANVIFFLLFILHVNYFQNLSFERSTSYLDCTAFGASS